jgi:hypothetical protein
MSQTRRHSWKVPLPWRTSSVSVQLEARGESSVNGFDTGDIVAGAGILVSGTVAIIGLVRTHKISDEQSALSRDMNQLVSEQNGILQEHNQILREVRGAPTIPAGTGSTESGGVAFLVDVGAIGRGNYRLTVTNTGRRTAEDVRITLDPEDVLPVGIAESMPSMRPGQAWRVPLAVSFATPPVLEWTVTWREGAEAKSDSGHAAI